MEGPSNTCYKFVITQKVTWAQAIGFCMDMGGHLATLDSEIEITWMKGYRSHKPELRHEELWLAGYLKDGRWMWKGEVADALMLSTDWAATEPNNYQNSQGCLQLYADTATLDPATQWFRFDDVSCDDMQGYVCEKYDD